MEKIKIDYLINKEIYDENINKFKNKNIDVWDLSEILDGYYKTNKLKLSTIHNPFNLIALRYNYNKGKFIVVECFENATYDDIININSDSIGAIDLLTFSILFFNANNSARELTTKKFFEGKNLPNVKGISDIMDMIVIDTNIESIYFNPRIMYYLSIVSALEIIMNISNEKNKIREFKKVIKRQLYRCYDKYDKLLEFSLDCIDKGIYTKGIPVNALNTIIILGRDTEDKSLINRLFELLLIHDDKDVDFPDFVEVHMKNIDISRIDLDKFTDLHGADTASKIGLGKTIPTSLANLSHQIRWSSNEDIVLIGNIFTIIDLLDKDMYKLIIPDIADAIVDNKLRKHCRSLEQFKDTALINETSTLFEDISELIINKLEELPLSKIETRVNFILKYNKINDEYLPYILYNTMMKKINKCPKIAKFVMLNKI